MRSVAAAVRKDGTISYVLTQPQVLVDAALNGNPVGLIDAIGYPIAADTGLVPLALFIEGESVLETAGVNFGNI